MPIGTTVGRPSSFAMLVRWSPAQMTSASWGVPSQPLRPKKRRSFSAASGAPSIASRATSCHRTGYTLCRSIPEPPVLALSVGSHSAKSFIQPSAPRAIAARILPITHARAPGSDRSMRPESVNLAPVKR